MQEKHGRTYLKTHVWVSQNWERKGKYMFIYADEGTIDIQTWDTPNQEQLSDIATKAMTDHASVWVWQMCWQGQVWVETEKRLAGAPVTSSTKLKVGGRCVLTAGQSEYGPQNTDLLVHFSTGLEIWDLVWELSYLFWNNLFKHIFVI